jgi:hypothetical protein
MSDKTFCDSCDKELVKAIYPEKSKDYSLHICSCSQSDFIYTTGYKKGKHKDLCKKCFKKFENLLKDFFNDTSE